MIFIFIFSLLVPSSFAQDKQMAAIEKLFAIFDPIKKGTSKQVFTVESCKIPQKTLLELALLRKPVKASFKFMKGCDVEGEVELHVAKPFPVSLKVRNLDKYSHVKFNSTLNVGNVNQGVGYKIELTEGNLSEPKSSVLFTGVYNYIVAIGETNKPGTEQGGELTILSIDGKAIRFTKLLGAGVKD
jgi:hypothetical protein